MGTDMDDPRLGEVIGDRYELLAVLGSGGMGIVYKAWHTLLKTTVAIKLIKPNTGQVASVFDQMLIEAQATVRIKHPNVVTVLDAGRTRDGEVFIVMEHLEGSNLEVLLGAEQPLEIERARSLLLQIASGLTAAHAQGVIHRDVKPANCMVTSSDGDSETIKILDFGIAKILEDTNDTAKVNPSTRPVRTQHYAAPEVVHGSASSPRSDVYSLGVLAYRLLTKKYPRSEVFKFVPPEQHRPDLPPALSELLCDMLEQEPDRRPQSMAEVHQRLEDAAFGGALAPEWSLEEGTIPDAISPDTIPAETSSGPVPKPRRWGLIPPWGRWVVLGALGTATVIMASSSYPRGMPSSPTPTIVSVGPESKPTTVPRPRLISAAPASDSVPVLEEQAERSDPLEPSTRVEQVEPSDPAAAPLDATPAPARPRDPMKRAKNTARRFLKRECGPQSPGARVTISFEARKGKVLYPDIASSKAEVKTCIFNALTRSTLPDGPYDLRFDL